MAKRRRRPRPGQPRPFVQHEPEPTGNLVLAGPASSPEGPMTEGEANTIVAGSCDRKHRYETWSHAHRDAVHVIRDTGQHVTAYQCPFGSIRDGRHWHVGHPPTIDHMERLALAVRFVAEHPDLIRAPRLR